MSRWLALAAVVALVAAPWLMARPPEAPPADARRLIVLTPHNEYVRLEFERAFAAWSRRELGQAVAIDWRTGGTSDLAKLVDGQFKAAAKRELRVDLGAADAAVAGQAKEALAASTLGIGADLFFGGGSRELGQLADKGYLVDAGIAALEPAWFADGAIPARIGNEALYDAKGRWYGVSLSSFGVCGNVDRCAEIGIATPIAWTDLGDPRLVGQVSIGDPTKSGSIAACYEMIVHSRMTAAGGADAEALDAGWRDGLTLVKRIVANARSVNDGAGRVVRDVARGEAAAGMVISTYGRLEAEWSARESGGRERLVFREPEDGTSISPDPIGLMQGAPNRDLAVACIRFALSPEWQRVLCYRLGVDGGPARHALRNLPVHRALYGAAHRAMRSDPDADPYALAGRFQYRKEWTGRHFALIRSLIKAVALDPRPELESAWKAIVAAGGPDAVPEAMAEFAWLPFAYRDADEAKKPPSDDPLAMRVRLREWSEEARRRYAAAERLAKAATR
ncbi:MAG TPA: extracellular solute-binding protein [Planctomycetota bacterium]|nr:extracellular solute-binding protein [Planctomycetota bacterium]